MAHEHIRMPRKIIFKYEISLQTICFKSNKNIRFKSKILPFFILRENLLQIADYFQITRREGKNLFKICVFETASMMQIMTTGRPPQPESKELRFKGLLTKIDARITQNV